MDVNIGSFRNPEDKKAQLTKYQQYIDLEIENQLKSKDAYRQYDQQAYFPPVPAIAPSADEELADESLQRNLAYTNLKQIFKSEKDIGRVLDGFTNDDIVLLNRYFESFLKELKGSDYASKTSNINPAYFNTAWNAFMTDHTRTTLIASPIISKDDSKDDLESEILGLKELLDRTDVLLKSKGMKSLKRPSDIEIEKFINANGSGSFKTFQDLMMKNYKDLFEEAGQPFTEDDVKFILNVKTIPPRYKTFVSIVKKESPKAKAPKSPPSAPKSPPSAPKAPDAPSAPKAPDAPSEPPAPKDRPKMTSLDFGKAKAKLKKSDPIKKPVKEKSELEKAIDKRRAFVKDDDTTEDDTSDEFLMSPTEDEVKRANSKKNAEEQKTQTKKEKEEAEKKRVVAIDEQIYKMINTLIKRDSIQGYDAQEFYNGYQSIGGTQYGANITRRLNTLVSNRARVPLDKTLDTIVLKWNEDSGKSILDALFSKGKKPTGSGITTDVKIPLKQNLVKFLPIGNKIVSILALKRGILDLRYPSKIPIKDFPKVEISHTLANMVWDLLTNNNFNKNDYKQLARKEKLIFDDFITLTKLSVLESKSLMGHKKELNEDREELLKKIELLAGEICAGNSNPKVIKDLKQSVVQAYKKKYISRAKYTNMLEFLVAW